MPDPQPSLRPMRPVTRHIFEEEILPVLKIEDREQAENPTIPTNPATHSAPEDELKYTVILFADEGRGELNGHVFVGLSDGKTTGYHGFYSRNKALALLSLGGGQIKDDSKLAESGWDVKKTYNITKEGYDKAINAIKNWETEGRPWGILHHCGDFGETIAKAAGAPIELPKRPTGWNRPQLFGEYLRNQGGVVNKGKDSPTNESPVFGIGPGESAQQK